MSVSNNEGKEKWNESRRAEQNHLRRKQGTEIELFPASSELALNSDICLSLPIAYLRLVSVAVPVAMLGMRSEVF